MIALLRYEVWRAFWAGLILTLLLGTPLLTHDNGEIQALLVDRNVSRDLARLAIAMPFGLALVQFGLERWRGLLPLLVHRGTPACRIHGAKSIVGLSLSALFLIGVLAIEARLAVRSGQPAVLIREALWVLPQLLCLAGLSWSTGELASRGSRRGAAATGARLGAAYLMLHGLHAWGRELGHALAVPFGLWAYCALMAAVGAGLWAHSHHSYGRPDPVRTASEPRSALAAALVLLCLWPNIDNLRSQVGALMQMRLEAVEPSLQVDGEGRVYELFHEERDFRLEPLGGGPSVAVTSRDLRQYQAPPVMGDPRLHLSRSIRAGRSKEAVGAHSSQFQAGVQRQVLFFGARLEDPDWEAFGPAFADARRDGTVSASLYSLLPDRRLELCYEASAQGRRRRGESDRLHAEFHPQRSDGRPLSGPIWWLDEELLIDQGDGTVWRLDWKSPGTNLTAFPAPPGRLLGVEELYSRSTWSRLARLESPADGVHTEAGTFRYDGSGWEKVAEGGELLTAEALLAGVPAPLHLRKQPDVLGRHRSLLIDGNGQTIQEFDTSREGRRAESRRRTLLAARLCALPATALAAHDPALGDLRLGQGLPGWVAPVHAGIGLLAALAAALLQRSGRGRWAAVPLGLLLGPLYPLALYAASHERRLALRAGPRGLPAQAPLFSDREAPALGKAA